ncbi:DUF3467 domain-containing protein [Methanolapillus millepedarum]|uniref:DUF3467 domain-containing protein n=1 Tax=Methanolapillus millepedarum TaxID=3028296 RepID=A0AA96V2M6_9EURY|nr:hypothetical protein MsAc7_09540 [Methanosarcinaceae archaeon Ac7]
MTKKIISTPKNKNETDRKRNPIDQKEKISIIRTPLFTKTYATNVSVIRTDLDFRIELFNEKYQAGDEWIYHSDGLAILTPQAAKILLTELSLKMEEYEKENGDIDISEKQRL